jgi:hypothetical protein
MNVLRLFVGDQEISWKVVLAAVGALAWFGLAINGLYDLWKLLPTIFCEGPLVADWQNIILSLLPFLLFLLWSMFYVYPKIKRIVSKSSRERIPDKAVVPHRGIVISLSRPAQMTPQEVIDQIKQVNDPITLYSLWSIGQLFKGLYYHKGTLRYVWPLSTDESQSYRICIDEFVKKFIPDAKLCPLNVCHLPTGSDLEMIERTKSMLSHIYSKENLNTLSLNISDIIVDITGGTKAITIGLAFGALDSNIDIQYVEQKKYDVIPLAISPEIVLDKIGSYLLELYSKIRIKKVG